MVDGYFSPVIGTLGNKLYEQVCCMLKPYFWTVRTWLYMSLDSWNKLTPEQQKVITDSIVATEKWTPGILPEAHRQRDRRVGEQARHEGHRAQG